MATRYGAGVYYMGPGRYEKYDPGPYSSERGGSIRDLILLGGQIQADAANRQAKALQDAGASFQTSMTKYLEEKAAREKEARALEMQRVKEAQAKEIQAAKDAEVASTVYGWDRKDPNELFAKLVPHLGTEGATGLVKAALSFEQLGREQGEKALESDKAALQEFANNWPSVPEGIRQQAWGQIREKAARVAPHLGLVPSMIPEQYVPGSPEVPMINSVMANLAKRDDKLMKMGAGEQLIDPQTGEVRASVPNTPKPGEIKETSSGFVRIDPTTGAATPLTDAQGRQLRGWHEPQSNNGPKGEIKDTPEGMMVVDPRTGKATPVVGPEGKQIKGKGGASNSNSKDKLATAMPVLNSIKELSAKINIHEGPTAIGYGIQGKVLAKANLDDNVAEYQSLTEGAVPLVARAFGHTGVLTQQDVDSVRRLFPSVTDSKTLANRKLARIDKLIETSALAGDDVNPDTGQPYTLAEKLARLESDTQGVSPKNLKLTKKDLGL